MSYPYRYAPNAEVHAAAIIPIYNHYRRAEVLESVREHHLEDLEEDHWYPVDELIELFTEWFEMESSMSNLVSVGMALIYHMEFPPELEDLDTIDKLLALGELHMLHHRNGAVGSYQAELVSPNHIVYTENTIWPDDMIYGYLYGAAQRMLPNGVHFILRYDDSIVRQQDGGATTVFHLTWS